MVRKKKVILGSFLKYFGLLLFILGIGLSFIFMGGGSKTDKVLQIFSYWLSNDILILVENEVFFSSACCFALAYLSTGVRDIILPRETSVSEGNLVIKKIMERGDEKSVAKKISKNKSELNDLINEKVKILSEQIEAARHDLFNLMLDINGINSADDAQRSLDSLEKSISVIKDLKKLTVNEKY